MRPCDKFRDVPAERAWRYTWRVWAEADRALIAIDRFWTRPCSNKQLRLFWERAKSGCRDNHRNQAIPKRLASVRSTWRSVRILEERTGRRLRAKSCVLSCWRDSHSRFERHCCVYNSIQRGGSETMTQEILTLRDNGYLQGPPGATNAQSVVGEDLTFCI